MLSHAACECGLKLGRAVVFRSRCEQAPARRRSGFTAPLLMAAFVVSVLCGCNFRAVAPERPPSGPSDRVDELTPAQDFSAEVLAYLLQVVVGQAGATENRPGWRSAGADMPLDYHRIATLMTTPGVPKSSLFSMDASLQGLSKVLYYYNPRLNQFKGQYVFDSPYPSSELIAVRLLILRKLANGERIRLDALMRNEARLRPGSAAPAPAELAAMNLSAEEFRFLRDVFASEPLFFQYYKHPFIVDALIRVGFYENAPSAKALQQQASYRPYARGPSDDRSYGETVTIAILPSMTREFEFGDRHRTPDGFGFQPTATYLQVLETIKAGILERTAAHLQANLQSADPRKRLDAPGWQRLWERTYRPRIRFQVYDQRPFAVYPETADRVVDALCPSANRVIVVLGRDVYQAVDWSVTRDPSPVFLDIAEIEHRQAEDRIDEIALSVTQQLEPFPFPVVEMTP